MLGAHHVDPLLEHVTKTMGVSVKRGAGAHSTDEVAQAECAIDDGKGGRIPIIVSKDTTEFRKSLDTIDQTILTNGALSVAAVLLLAIVLARTLSRPLSELADEARKVASGEARPVRTRGSGEIADLTQRVRSHARRSRRDAPAARRDERASLRGARSRVASRTR